MRALISSRRPSRRAVLSFVLLAPALAGVSACETPPPRPTFPDIRFTDLPPLRLDVAAVDSRDEYRPPFHTPNVEHLFPVPPARALENWARDRLRAVGRTGRARFTIREASVVETELKTTGGLKGALTTEPAQRYNLTIEASLDILDDRGMAVRTVTVKAARSQGVLEGITPNQRDETWYALTKAAMADFNQQMEAEIRANFGSYLR